MFGWSGKMEISQGKLIYCVSGNPANTIGRLRFHHDNEYENDN